MFKSQTGPPAEAHASNLGPWGQKNQASEASLGYMTPNLNQKKIIKEKNLRQQRIKGE